MGLEFSTLHNGILAMVFIASIAHGEHTLRAQRAGGGPKRAPGLFRHWLTATVLAFAASQVYFDFLHPHIYPPGCVLGLGAPSCAYGSGLMFGLAWALGVWTGWQIASRRKAEPLRPDL